MEMEFFCIVIVILRLVCQGLASIPMTCTNDSLLLNSRWTFYSYTLANCQNACERNELCMGIAWQNTNTCYQGQYNAHWTNATASPVGCIFEIPCVHLPASSTSRVKSVFGKIPFSGGVVHFECAANTPVYLTGGSNSICNRYGEWNNYPMVCTDKFPWRPCRSFRPATISVYHTYTASSLDACKARCQVLSYCYAIDFNGTSCGIVNKFTGETDTVAIASTYCDVAGYCPDPGSGTGSIRKNHDPFYRPGMSVVYHCEPGKIAIEGTNWIQCTRDGTWSGKPMSCIDDPARQCHTDKRVHGIGFMSSVSQTGEASCISYCHISKICTAYEYNNILEYCQFYSGNVPLTIVSASSTKLCVIDVTCPDPGFPLKSSRTPSTAQTFKVGQYVVYSCVTNYRHLAGSQVRRCQRDSTWSGIPFFCSGATCEARKTLSAVKGTSHSVTTHSQCHNRCVGEEDCLSYESQSYKTCTLATVTVVSTNKRFNKGGETYCEKGASIPPTLTCNDRVRGDGIPSSVKWIVPGKHTDDTCKAACLNNATCISLQSSKKWECHTKSVSAHLTGATLDADDWSQYCYLELPAICDPKNVSQVWVPANDSSRMYKPSEVLLVRCPNPDNRLTNSTCLRNGSWSYVPDCQEIKTFLYEAYTCSESPPARFVWLDHPFLEPLIDDKSETCFNTSLIKTSPYRVLVKAPQYLRIKTISLTLKNVSGCSPLHGVPMLEVWKSYGYCHNSDHCGSPYVLSPIVGLTNDACTYLWRDGAAFTNEIVLLISSPIVICHVTVM